MKCCYFVKTAPGLKYSQRHKEYRQIGRTCGKNAVVKSTAKRFYCLKHGLKIFGFTNHDYNVKTMLYNHGIHNKDGFKTPVNEPHLREEDTRESRSKWW